MTEDIYRKYIEEAVRVIRPFQGKKTPFLYVEKREFYKKNTACSIPLYENALFALLLLRKKTHEEMSEGKTLLQKILPFQSFRGSFPTEIAQYPASFDVSVTIRIGFLLEIVLRDFSSILGEELHEHIIAVKESISSFIRENVDKDMLGSSFITEILAYVLLSRFEAAFQKIEECTYEVMDLQSRGRLLVILDFLPDHPVSEKCLQHLFRDWNVQSGMYQGPGVGVFHHGNKAACSLFDVWMSLHSGVTLKRPFMYESLFELALLCPKKEKIYENKIFIEESPSPCFIEPKPHQLEGFYPLRLVIGQETICWKFPGGKLVNHVEIGDSSFQSTIERVNDSSELFHIFVERTDGIELLVDGQKSTWFDPHKGFEIRNKNVVVKIALNSFGGDCTGLISLGNRPSQLLPYREVAFDWMVTCECIRGSIPKNFSMRMNIEYVENLS